MRINRISESEKKIKQTIADIIFNGKGWAGRVFDIFLFFFILLGTLVIIIETVPSIKYKYGETLASVEWFIVLFFTVEYVLRIYCAQPKKKYIFSFYGIIDFISIAPVYLAIFLPAIHYLALFRAFRLIRVFRVLKLFPLVQEQSTLYRSIKSSIPKILIFLTFTFVSSIVFASLMYIVEGPVSGFSDIPTSLYWTIVTITTVGYGDITPITSAGKIIASLIMLSGYGVIAVPTGIVVSEYNKASASESR